MSPTHLTAAILIVLGALALFGCAPTPSMVVKCPIAEPIGLECPDVEEPIATDLPETLEELAATFGAETYDSVILELQAMVKDGDADKKELYQAYRQCAVYGRTWRRAWKGCPE